MAAARPSSADQRVRRAGVAVADHQTDRPCGAIVGDPRTAARTGSRPPAARRAAAADPIPIARRPSSGRSPSAGRPPSAGQAGGVQPARARVEHPRHRACTGAPSAAGRPRRQAERACSLGIHLDVLAVAASADRERHAAEFVDPDRASTGRPAAMSATTAGIGTGPVGALMASLVAGLTLLCRWRQRTRLPAVEPVYGTVIQLARLVWRAAGAEVHRHRRGEPARHRRRGDRDQPHQLLRLHLRRVCPPTSSTAAARCGSWPRKKSSTTR